MPSVVLNELLDGVEPSHAEHLVRAFDIMAAKLGHVTNSTALWAIATLLAKVFAGCSLDDALMAATGARFSEMLRAAYPAMVQALEADRREAEGRPPFDA